MKSNIMDHRNSGDSQAQLSIKMDFSQRLLRLMREVEFTQAELARQSGESATKINEYTKGKILPSAMTAIALADALGVSVPELMLGRAGHADRGLQINILDASTPLINHDLADLKIYDGFITLDQSFLLQSGRDSTNDLIAVKQNGDAMAPLIHDGSYVLIDKSDRVLREGVFCYRIDNAIHIRRLMRSGRSDVRAVCTNKDYPAEIYTGQILDHLTILGRAIWAGTKL